LTAKLIVLDFGNWMWFCWLISLSPNSPFLESSDETIDTFLFICFNSLIRYFCFHFSSSVAGLPAIWIL